MKAKVIPVIIRATGTISKSLRQYLSNVLGKHEIRELQKKKKSHIWHCTQTAGSANVKVQNNFTSEITFHMAQTVNREQLQHYVL